MRSLKPDITTSQDLSVDALSYTTSIGRACRIDAIIFKASVNITETITITLDSKNGANYDVKLRTIELVAGQNAIYIPDDELNLQAGDEIKIQCTNANLTGVLYAVIKTSELKE